MVQLILSLLFLTGSALGGLQTGDLIGFQLKPNNEAQVQVLSDLRNSDVGYLFWSGSINVGQVVGALVPLSLERPFLEAVGNVSLFAKATFDPVTMTLFEKEEQSRMGPAATVILEKAAELAVQVGATAMSRLSNELFGNGRGARSTDIALYNTVNKDFRLTGYNCGTGIWTSNPDMLPVFQINAKSCVVYGTESHGFLTGATDCKVEYTSTDSSRVSFTVSVSNPYIGSNHAEWSWNGVQLSVIVGGGNNNLVHVTVY